MIIHKITTEIHPIKLEKNESPLTQVENYIKSICSNKKKVIRWGVLTKKNECFYTEISFLFGDNIADKKEILLNSPQNNSNQDINIALAIPTGVGANIGGYIGDAGPFVKLLEAVADRVVLHGNIVNAADFYGSNGQSSYTEGYTLDEFFMGRTRLYSGIRPKIGLLIDKMNEMDTVRIINAANAMKAVHGINIIGYKTCNEKIRAFSTKSDYGHYIGQVDNPQVLTEGAEYLKKSGANCIAVVTNINGLTRSNWLDHYKNNVPNPIGAVEALISRAITYCTDLPSAHAPANLLELSCEELLNVDPRTSAETISGSGVPSILMGLSKAVYGNTEVGMSVQELSAIIVPENCCGGIPSLGAMKYGIPLICIKNNTCSVGVNCSDINAGISVTLSSYTELVSWLIAKKYNISWDALQRPLVKLAPL